MKSTLLSSIALACTSLSHADIFQYGDCNGDGSLLLTELDAVPGVDLSGLYLGCALLEGADLSGADLSGADLTDAFVNGANLSGADLSRALLAYTDLTLAALSDANLSGTEMPYTNLTFADLSDAILNGANLSNADLTGVRSNDILGQPIALPPEWILINGHLVGPGANLSGADLHNTDLTNTNLSDADLYGADLTGADLTNVNLSNAFLAYTILEDTDLSSANLSGTFLDGTIICPVTDQIGSCCVNSGCASIAEADCSDLGGIWTEGGSCDDCEPVADDCPADVDGDGSIGFSDVLIILNDWGACP